MIRRLRLPPDTSTGWRRQALRLARWLRRVAWWVEARATATARATKQRDP